MAALLAACGKPKGGHSPASAPPLDTNMLARDVPALVQRAKPGDFNLGVMGLDRNEPWFWDENKPYPMQSVFKAPMAAAAMAEVDAGRLRLDETIRLTEMDLSPPFSLINQAWPTPPAGHTRDMTVSELMTLAVQDSDNTAADVLMKRIGGPGAVTAWLQAKEVPAMRIDRYERDLQQEAEGMAPFRPEWKDEKAWTAARDTLFASARQQAMDAYLVDPRDTTSAQGAIDFLVRLGRGDLISKTSTRFLLKLMEGAHTGASRLKAGLPKGAKLAHKTGTSRTDLGFTPAVGDIGIITLADGRRLAIAAFLAGSTATDAERDALFADAARLLIKAAG
jgi:beta-lactamase class A